MGRTIIKSIALIIASIIITAGLVFSALCDRYSANDKFIIDKYTGQAIPFYDAIKNK